MLHAWCGTRACRSVEFAKAGRLAVGSILAASIAILVVPRVALVGAVIPVALRPGLALGPIAVLVVAASATVLQHTIECAFSKCAHSSITVSCAASHCSTLGARMAGARMHTVLEQDFMSWWAGSSLAIQAVREGRCTPGTGQRALLHGAASRQGRTGMRQHVVGSCLSPCLHAHSHLYLRAVMLAVKIHLLLVQTLPQPTDVKQM